MNKKMKILIAVSLCLNVLLAGLLIGFEGKRFVKWKDHHHPFFKELRISGPQHLQLRKSLGKEREKIIDMVIEGPYDEKEYLIQIDKMNILQSQLFKDMALNMAKILNDMPKEERLALKHKIKKRFGHVKKK